MKLISNQGQLPYYDYKYKERNMIYATHCKDLVLFTYHLSEADVPCN